ncbi:MAG: MJ1244 family protein [Euryarchaeota archaeon]|nr:MJ1244 family protein [Euryarchaeota archaeon]
MAKVLLNIFVDYETLGKTINILTEEGVTGFYCVEYWGVSPQNWSGFIIKEEPEMAIEAIRDNTERAIQVNAVVNEDRAEAMMQALTEKLAGRRHTIMRLPVDAIRVTAP